MEYLRSLFGTLQQALDFVSSFTTYLFGNEPHPGAEEVGNEREMKNCRSHHDSEVETAYPRDVSPREQLKVTEGPFIEEITPLSQDTQGTLEIAVTADQAMDSFFRPSKFPNRCEGQEESEQKFSASSVCLSDTTELGSTTTVTDIIQQAPMEAPAMTGRLYQRKSEESALVEVAQEDMIEELADSVCSQYCSQLKPDEILAERRDLGQMEEEGKTGMSQEAEPDRNVLAEGIQQGTPNWAASVEEKRDLEGAGWTEEIVRGSMEERAGIMDNQQLEVEKEQEEGKMGEKAQGEINTVVLNQAEDKVLEEERMAGKSQLWDEEAEKNADGQEKELENMLWNEGIQQKLLDVTQDRKEKQIRQEDATWSEGTQQDRLEKMAKTERDQQLNVEKEREEDTRVDGNEQVKTSVTGKIEGDQIKMLEEKGKGDRSWNLEECIGGTEEGKERKMDEKEEVVEGVTWTDKLQYDTLNVTIVKTQDLESGKEQGEGIELDADHQIMKEMVTKNEEILQPLLDKEEMTSQKEALEGVEKEISLYWEPKETEIMIEQKMGASELEKWGNCKQEDLPEKGKTEENLKQEVEESVKNEIHITGGKQGQQIREEWWENKQEEQPEILVDTCDLNVEMLQVTESISDQSNQLGETTKNLVYPTSLDTDLLAGPRAFPHDVTMLDSSAQKERVLLRRKSSIRRAPSLKKPKPSSEAPAEETKMAEDAPPLLEVPKRQNPRLSGFGPMHPNMMAELQMRLQKPK